MRKNRIVFFIRSPVRIFQPDLTGTLLYHNPAKKAIIKVYVPYLIVEIYSL